MNAEPFYVVSTHVLGWKCARRLKIFWAINPQDISEPIPEQTRRSMEAHMAECEVRKDSQAGPAEPVARTPGEARTPAE